MAARNELHDLADDLADARDDIIEEGRKVVGRGCFNIKRDWKARWTGHPHITHLPHTISYDVTVKGDIIRGETGPDKDKGGQAHLAHFIEFGDEDQAPIPGGLPALDAEEPKFINAVADLSEKLLARHG